MRLPTAMLEEFSLSQFRTTREGVRRDQGKRKGTNSQGKGSEIVSWVEATIQMLPCTPDAATSEKLQQNLSPWITATTPKPNPTSATHIDGVLCLPVKLTMLHRSRTLLSRCQMRRASRILAT